MPTEPKNTESKNTEPVSTASRGLRTEGLTVRYGGLVANDGIDVEVRPGEIVGLIGPNGAGKTTFVDAVTGFAPCEGRVLLDGRRVDGLPAHRRRRRGLSRTWQSGELFPNLSVYQNVVVATRPGGLRTVAADLFRPRRKGEDPAIARALAAVGLGDVSGRLARDLTLGRQKLVGVARALVGTCSLLLLDEPAAGLDSTESREFAGRLRAIAAADGPGILLIDHDMSLVLGVCDRVYVLEFGKPIFGGTPDEARADAAVVAAYLGVPMENADA
ncbi:ABC transporter ATP-binding protein [Actinomadura algeriensis]|uniref:Branched-chain amino acid transport system ATP-binding protein n=1 Tax=Actinomadura algeriensis TaxID=1679523 RepID=A0ABR9JZ87_9ACTN|nr:ABC transporter ATP-binding protein [Actinomadura algeriensis]MBE1535883.1 branched-chain amino acid transport system ATP-binding protein [Actinomadura algeriensis]